MAINDFLAILITASADEPVAVRIAAVTSAKPFPSVAAAVRSIFNDAVNANGGKGGGGWTSGVLGDGRGNREVSARGADGSRVPGGVNGGDGDGKNVIVGGEATTAMGAVQPAMATFEVIVAQ